MACLRSYEKKRKFAKVSGSVFRSHAEINNKRDLRKAIEKAELSMTDKMILLMKGIIPVEDTLEDHNQGERD